MSAFRRRRMFARQADCCAVDLSPATPLSPLYCAIPVLNIESVRAEAGKVDLGRLPKRNLGDRFANRGRVFEAVARTG